MHVAVIMDGNGRWAKKQGRPRLFGHNHGATAAKRCVEAALKNQVKTLTLFAFSTENWNRSESEVQGLMKLFINAIEKNQALFHEHHIRFFSIGDRSRFSKSLQKAIQKLENETQNYDRFNLVIAANYGARWDIENAHKMASAANSDTLEPFLALNRLNLANPEVDLMIRTGGEKRVSNFLLWHLAYSELYFTDVYWPDFNETHFAEALEFYRTRNRKFGRA